MIPGPTNKPVVLIEWVDSARVEGWHFMDDLHNKAHSCVSIGWIVAENANCVTVVPSMSDNKDGNFDQFLGTIRIPREAIKEIHLLQAARHE